MDTAVLAVRTLLSLAVVLGLIWYAGRRLNDSTAGRSTDGRGARLLRRLGHASVSPTRRGAGRPEPVVTIAGRQSLGPRASVTVVDVGGQRLVLGVSEAGISVLSTLETPAPLPVVEPGPVAGDESSRSGAPDGSTTADDAAFAALLDQARADQAAGTSTLVDAVPAGVLEARTSALDGSVLSPSTWRQAVAAVQSRTVRR